MRMTKKIDPKIKEKRDVVRKEILEKAEKLYVEELLTIGETVEAMRRQGYPLAMWRLSNWLNSRGVARSSAQTIVERRKAKIDDCMCAIPDCNNPPKGCKRYCEECIPDSTALKAWYDHGLTHKQVTAIFASQGNVCAGCKQSLLRGMKGSSRSRNNFCVDHDHVTGKIRGILCHRCNTILGLSKDSMDVLRSLSVYLEQERDFPTAFSTRGKRAYPLQQPSDRHPEDLLLEQTQET